MSEQVRDILGAKSVNRSQDIFACADRVSPGDDAKDVTIIRNEYLPLDLVKQSTYLRTSPFGATLYRQTIKAGSVVPSYDGKRLVLEVGCSTVLYILINPQSAMHHRVFVQSDRGFNADTTIRRDAAEIYKNTRHIETIAKYEIYFIMGVLSTMGIAAWLAVTGADVTYVYAGVRSKADAAKILTQELLQELAIIETYAPTLHQKLVELIAAEIDGNWGRLGKQLPSTIIRDEKTQAQVAGILFGQWANSSGKGFTVWTVLTTLLIQAGSKSATKSFDAYQQVVETRYGPAMDKMSAIDSRAPNTISAAAIEIIKLMKSAGVEMTQNEGETIIREVTSNPKKSAESLTNIKRSIEKFEKSMSR